MKIEVMATAETAYYLRSKLGPKNWNNFLSDCIRNKQHILGLQLLPVARKFDSKALRPVYALTDVENFVAEVLIAMPTAGAVGLETAMLDIDMGRSWKVNKHYKDGSKIKPRCVAGAVICASH